MAKKRILYPKGEKWRHLKKYLEARRAFLSTNDRCVICKEYGIDKTATVMDHIRPHRDDHDLFWDIENWQALCKYHHDQKTAMEDGGMGNPIKSQDWPDIGQRVFDCGDVMDAKDLI